MYNYRNINNVKMKLCHVIIDMICYCITSFTTLFLNTYLQKNVFVTELSRPQVFLPVKLETHH